MHVIIVAQAASWPADTMQILSPNEALMTFIFSKLDKGYLGGEKQRIRDE